MCGRAVACSRLAKARAAAAVENIANEVHVERIESSLPYFAGWPQCALLRTGHHPSMPAAATLTTPQDGSYDLSAAPPFSLSDIRDAIPKHLWVKDGVRSMAHLALDVGIVAALAAGAYALNAWWAWPAYWLAQGTMFWALFVVGHDCGHQSFSNNRDLNDLVGNITHSSILVPYHGWVRSNSTACSANTVQCVAYCMHALQG